MKVDTKFIINDYLFINAPLGPILFHSGPSDIPFSPNQFLGLDFFCRFLHQHGTNIIESILKLEINRQTSWKKMLDIAMLL